MCEPTNTHVSVAISQAVREAMSKTACDPTDTSVYEQNAPVHETIGKAGYEPSRVFFSCHVAGFAHWYGLEVFDVLRPGVELQLVSESDNPYDPGAVALYLGETKIGYIPRKLNKEISQLLYFGHGDIFSARVSHIYPDNHPEHQVMITVFVRDKRG